MDKKFIKTTDEDTAKLLREAGFQELTKEGSRYVFVNDTDKINFSSDVMKDVQTTNILHF